MRRFTAMVVLLFAVCVTGVLGQTTPVSEADAVRTVLTANPVPADLFAASFLAQVPLSKIIPIRQQVTAPLGTFLRIEGANGQYIAYYTRGTVKVTVHLDVQGKIDGLLLSEPTVTAGGTMEDALKPFASLPGKASYVVIQDGKEIAAYGQAERLAVGSTFKLAILNALRKQIERGSRHWRDVTSLMPGWKSLPSGVLQTWPTGSLLTLQTLATEMISISDNTAADALANIVGRGKAIAPYAGVNDPFLTTREMFGLKSKSNAALREKFRSGDSAQRAMVVAQIGAQALPAPIDLDTNPALSDIEWHYSNRELCTLMRGVEDLALMSINPGVAARSQWKRVAYKGGSDFGVISMTSWLVAKNGKTYCVSATLNNTAAQVDETTFEALYATLLSTLANR